ncbi:MAG: hypothetical protein KGL39_31770 [Patescibacteria group bacterium]|nr:hypothetical protein [Patescibacteria group bacterium]
MFDFSALLSSPAGWVALAVLGFFIGSQVFAVKQWEASWKQYAIDTSKAMSKAGLVHSPKILDELAVGDLAGAFQEVKGLADIFKDPKQLGAEFETVFQNMLKASLADPTQAKAMQQLVNDAVAAFASGNPAAATQQLAADAQTLAAGNPLFAGVAQHGLNLALLPALTANPVLAAVANALQQSGATHLIPTVLTAATQATAVSNAAQSNAAPPVPETPGKTLT